jgi:DNA relaxase NicK
VTRLDVAWDDKTEQVTGVLDVDLVRDEVKAGHFTSRWKGGHGRWGWGNQDGETVYFGSGSSDAMLRVYNKRLERIAKGHADQVEGVGHWQRVELQLRRERADAAAELFQGVTRDRARTMRTLAGILRGYLDFKVPSSTDTNRRRWVTAPWWAAFLGFVEKCKLVVERVRRTVETVKAWLSSCAGPSLALVQEALGVVAGRAWLAETVDQGRARWGAKHRAILAASGLAVPAGAAFGG